MSASLLDADPGAADIAEQSAPVKVETDGGRWMVFRYATAALFSLKMSRATSTSGKTLLTPTPYAAKMAFVDAALRHGLTGDPDRLVHDLAQANLRIGVPQHACATGTIQTVRQETPAVERRRKPRLPPYRANIAMREFVHFQGALRLAFDLESCTGDLIGLLPRAAPAINYLGKRGSFLQYLECRREPELDSTFTEPADDGSGDAPAWGHRATLDDFGPKASFVAMNSFSPAEMQRGVDRRFVDTVVPLGVYNSGPGFVHYCAPGAIL